MLSRYFHWVHRDRQISPASVIKSSSLFPVSLQMKSRLKGSITLSGRPFSANLDVVLLLWRRTLLSVALCAFCSHTGDICCLPQFVAISCRLLLIRHEKWCRHKLQLALKQQLLLGNNKVFVTPGYVDRPPVDRFLHCLGVVTQQGDIALTVKSLARECNGIDMFHIP